MPNGYTAPIYEGEENFTLRDYLMRVGRGMSFAMMQRDDDLSAPVRYVESDETYYKERVAEEQAKLDRLRNMTLSEARQAAAEDYAEKKKRWEQRRKDSLEMRKRYDEMESQVLAWDPPEELAYVKKYALQYLRESADFDCGKRGEEMAYSPKPKRLDGPEWLAKQIEECARHLEHLEETLAKSVDVSAQRKHHIDMFLEALP